MKQAKRSVIVWIVVTFVFILGLGGALFYYLQNKADASVGYDGTTCPQLSAPAPGWCSDGTIVASSPTSNGCPMPPTCLRSTTPTPTITSTTSCGGTTGVPCVTPTVTSTSACGTSNGVALPCASPFSSPMVTSTISGGQVTYNLITGFNIVVVPDSMFATTDPVSTAAFTSAGMTIYSYSNGNWQINPQFFRKMGSYIVKNPNSATTINLVGSGSMLVGAYNGQVLYKGWNTVANNSDSPKLLSEVVFKTYVPDNNCTTPPLCGEFKSMAQLFTDSRIYSRIYFFNDLTSSDANTFYATKILSSADLANYRIPARSGFWLYLYQ